MMKTQQSAETDQKLLTFSSGGWVLAIAGLLCLGIVVWAVAPALLHRGPRPPGDGRTIESYNFDLSNLSVRRELVHPLAARRDIVPVLNAPTATGPDVSITPDAGPDWQARRWETMQRRSEPKYGKYLVPSDRVIGVEINGEARAYPLSNMYVHEIINDTLAGVPIAVTYNWPSDSTMVFDRRVSGGRGGVVEFANSGLVYNSNLLMYDRNETRQDESTPRFGGGNESLWSQLLGAPISGQALEHGESLRTIPYQLVSWREWSARYPNTTVLDRDLSMAARYKKSAPTQYFNSDALLAPFDPQPPNEGPAAKTPVIAVLAGEHRRVYPLPQVIELAREAAARSGQPVVEDTLGSTRVRFVCDLESGTAWVESDQSANQPPIEAIHAFWFAWHAMFPEDELFVQGKERHQSS